MCRFGFSTVFGRVYNLTHRLHSSSFLVFIVRTLQGNPEKELLWSLWEALNPVALIPVTLNHVRLTKGLDCQFKVSGLFQIGADTSSQEHGDYEKWWAGGVLFQGP